jgi:hypothetical protein
MVMPITAPSVDEIVALLKRSSIPTIIVEGKDDVAIYRWINEKLGVLDVDVFPCVGRENLLKVYERRNEFSQLKTAFIADKDMWVFSSIPSNFNSIIFTSGYSIENDLYAGAVNKIESLVDEKHRDTYKDCISEVNKWFAFEVEKYLQGKEFSFDHNIREVLNERSKTLCTHFLNRKNFTMPNKEIIDDLSTNYPLKLRGKTLFSVLELFLEKEKFKREQLFKVLVMFLDDHEYISRILEELKNNFFEVA